MKLWKKLAIVLVFIAAAVETLFIGGAYAVAAKARSEAAVAQQEAKDIEVRARRRVEACEADARKTMDRLAAKDAELFLKKELGLDADYPMNDRVKEETELYVWFLEADLESLDSFIKGREDQFDFNQTYKRQQKINTFYLEKIYDAARRCGIHIRPYPGR